MNTLTTPVLIRKNNKSYRLMNITYEKDNSIYFSFPIKGEYKILKSHLESFLPSDNEIYEGREKIVTLEDVTESYKGAKISFHPRDMIGHIIDKDRNKLNGDFKLKSMYYDEFVIPFIQVLVPNDLNLLDEYNKTKYSTLLEIDDISDDDTISLEIYINRNKLPLNETDLFKAKRNLKGYYLFDSGHEYTCTIYLSTINCKNNNILVTLNSMNGVTHFILEKNGIDNYEENI